MADFLGSSLKAAQEAEARLRDEHERVIQWFKANPLAFNSYLLRAGLTALRHLVVVLVAAGSSATNFVVKDQVDGGARAGLLGLAFVSMALGYFWLTLLLAVLGQARNMVTWVGAAPDGPSTLT